MHPTWQLPREHAEEFTTCRDFPCNPAHILIRKDQQSGKMIDPHARFTTILYFVMTR